jgi:AcrR family transcriptional regulator
LKWVREPQQDRSARTRANLLDAAEKLLAAEGMSSVTVAKVVKLAGSSNGSFYHYFQDKRALLYAVVERRAIEVSVTVTQGLDPEIWADIPILDILEGYVRFSLKSGKRNVGVQEAQQVLAQQDPNVAARWARTNRETRAAIMAILEPKLEQVGHPEPKDALVIMLEALRSMVNRRLRGQVRGSDVALPKQTEEVFVREMRAMAAGYLQIPD